MENVAYLKTYNMFTYTSFLGVGGEVKTNDFAPFCGCICKVKYLLQIHMYRAIF